MSIFISTFCEEISLAFTLAVSFCSSKILSSKFSSFFSEDCFVIAFAGFFFSSSSLESSIELLSFFCRSLVLFVTATGFFLIFLAFSSPLSLELSSELLNAFLARGVGLLAYAAWFLVARYLFAVGFCVSLSVEVSFFLFTNTLWSFAVTAK